MELLAPAGNIDTLKAAVHNGADAVYLGVGKYNARAKADNFTLENIAEWVEYCHFYRCKVYVTINTNIYSSEFNDIAELITTVAAAQVDALIIADMATAKIAYDIAPQLPRHASTQMGIHNLASAKLAEKLGFSRVVLARESRLADIRAIKANCSLEIEYFVQGALCVCFSGACLLSALSSGNSGNRGGCLQPCRKLYSNSINGSDGYFLSAKDQNLCKHLAELSGCGVDSFKIEGRMRSPSYVASACRAIGDAIKSGAVSKDNNNNLAISFNRGNYTDGYNYDSLSKIIYSKHQGHIGLEVGKITKVMVNGGLYTMQVTTNGYKIVNKLGVKIFYTGREHDGFMVDNIAVIGHNVYEITHMGNPPAVGSTLNITRDDRISLGEQGRHPIDFDIILYNDLSIVFTASCNGIIFTKNIADFTQLAQSAPLSKDSIIKKFSLSGNQYFFLNNLIVDNVNGFFAPLSKLIQLRDEAIKYIYNGIIHENKLLFATQLYHSNIAPAPLQIVAKTSDDNGKFIIINSENYQQFCELDNCNIILNYDKKAISILQNWLIEKTCYIKLPKIAFGADLDTISSELKSIPNNVGIYADNLYAIELALTHNRHYIIGCGLNIFNSLAADIYAGDRVVPSVELSIRDSLHINRCLVYSYGKMPVMTLAHCPYATVANASDSEKKHINCNNCDYKDYDYYDKYGSYPIRRLRLAKCYFTMYNTVCHYLADKVSDSQQLVDLTIASNYNIIDNKIIVNKPANYTRGFNNKKGK